MNWESLTAEFRELGGVANNVRLGTGRFGRGVFVVDAAQPAMLHAGENLLAPIDQLEIRDGQLVLVAETTLGAREREFFDTYQRHFGWGAGLYDELWQTQKAWSELPGPVVAAVTNMGGLEDPDRRFAAPTDDLCLYTYLRTRQFTFGGKLHVTPLVELVNHSSTANGYDIDSGIGVHGTFAGEMFARYNFGDCWGRAMTASFTEDATLAHSLGITVNVYGQQQLTIRRETAAVDVHDGIRFPKAQIDDAGIRLPFLTLGCTTATDLPRAVFRKLVVSRLTTAQADETFDSIVHFNQTKFLALLRVLRNYHGPVVDLLEEAALKQLEVLACCIGARPLD